jgi:curved DNA-binding protein CbpA
MSADSNLYDDLGIEPSADQKAIKSAHRKAVRRTHPDTVGGGNREQFDKVQRAYLVLADPEKRRRYDADGTVDDQPDNTMGIITEMILAAFTAALGSAGPKFKNVNVIAKTRDHLRLMQKNEAARRNEEQEHLAIAEDLLGRVKFTNAGSHDPIGNMLRDRVSSYRSRIARSQIDESMMVAATAYLEHYGFEFTPQQTPESLIREWNIAP